MARKRRLKPWMIAAPLATGINLLLLALLAQETQVEPLEAPGPIIVAFELSPRDPRIHPRNLVSRPGAAPSNATPTPSRLAPRPPSDKEDEDEGPESSGSWIDPEWRVNRGTWGDEQTARPGQRDLLGLRQALRARQACLLNAPLTEQERERCREFWDEAAERGEVNGVPRALNLDPRGAFAKEAEPYLQRRPKNGCKPRAGGSVSPSGEYGVATGVSCAFQF